MKTALAFAASVLLLGGAHAADLKKAAPARASSNPINLLASWADADVKAAIAAATSFPSLQDTVGATCWTQISTLAAIVKAHPLPATFHLATDIEYARLIQASLNQLCRNPACAQVWSDAANAASSFAVIPLALSLPSLCAKVPVVGLSAVPPTN